MILLAILLILALCALPLVCGSVADLVRRSRRSW